MKPHTKLLFSSSSYDYLVKEVVRYGNYEMGEIERKNFPDGERYQRILNPVNGRDVVLIGGTINDREVLEIFDLACAMIHYGANTLTLVVPFYGYSTMERAIMTGEVVTAKNRARLFSSIPVAANGNRIAMIDLHSEGIPHYFEGSIHAVHLYAKPIILSTIHEIAGDNFVLACTDAGRAKWVESLANDLGVNAAFVFKRRLSGSETEVTAVSAQVEDQHVIIYDDMIRTGGSLINAAKAYRNAGAEKVSAIATHGLFPGDALEKLEKSGHFQQIVVTDTHPRAMELSGDFLKIKSIAGLIAGFFEGNLDSE